MAEVKILVEGYLTSDNNEEKSCSTITLIKSENLNIVVDPGTTKDQQVIIDALKKENLEINDIDFVFITHSHIDHYRNVGMFVKAKTLDFFAIYDGDKASDWEEDFNQDIKIIKTPGHNSNSITFLVKTEQGTIAVCGDVFWKENFPEKGKDPYASNLDRLELSRKLVLKLTDFIIPGHGKMFKVEK